MENLEPPPPPPNQGWENGAFLPFARLHPRFGGDGGLLFHFILSQITIVDKINGKPRPPPPPPNQGWKNGAFLPFARLHPWLGGDGGLLFHFILSKIVDPRGNELRHSGAMTHVLYHKFKTATKTAQICDQPKECEESGRKCRWNW